MSVQSASAPVTPLQASTSSATTRSRSLRALALAAVAVSSLTACKGDDGPVAASDDSAVVDPSATATSESTATSTAATGTDTGTATPVTSVVVTVPDNAPEHMIGEVGEVEIIGDTLPPYNGNISIEGDAGRTKKAPVLVGETFEGNELRVDAVKSGKPTLIYFLAHWCAHCNNEVPILNEMRDSNAFLPGLEVYGVITDMDPNKPNFPPSEWVKKVDWTYPSIRDGYYVEGQSVKTVAALAAYGGSSYPYAVLINPDGTVAARWSGEKSAQDTIDYINKYLAY